MAHRSEDGPEENPGNPGETPGSPGATPGSTGGARPHGSSPGDGGVARRRRRTALAAAAWVCSVVAAGVLGAWSFAHADPGGRYERPEALGDAGVRHELAQEKQRAARDGGRQQGEPGTSAEPGSSAEPDASKPPRDNGSSQGSQNSQTSQPGQATPSAVTSTVRFPGGVGTASARCEGDGTVRLLSWIPADGYSVDEAVRGPARTAKVELEPADDDADDVTVAVRCDDGKPHTSVVPEDGDDD